MSFNKKPSLGDARAEFKRKLDRFVAKFGRERGAKWAAEGLTYEQALERHIDALQADVAEIQAKINAVNQKLAAVSAAAPTGGPACCAPPAA
jgi:hypothetical protein